MIATRLIPCYHRESRQRNFDEAITLLEKHFSPEQYYDVFPFEFGYLKKPCNLLSLSVDLWYWGGDSKLQIEALLKVIKKMPLPDQAKVFGSRCESCLDGVIDAGTPLDLAAGKNARIEAEDLIVAAMEEASLHKYMKEHAEDDPACKEALDALNNYHRMRSSCTIL